MDYSPPGSSVCEILQARILEWVARSFSKGSSQTRNQTHVSCVSCVGRQILYQCTTHTHTYLSMLLLSHKIMSDCFATIWTVTHQAPLTMGFSRQEYWSGLSCPFPGDLPGPGIEPRTFILQADSLLSEPLEKPPSPTHTVIHIHMNFLFQFFSLIGCYKILSIVSCAIQ